MRSSIDRSVFQKATKKMSEQVHANSGILCELCHRHAHGFSGEVLSDAEPSPQCRHAAAKNNTLKHELQIRGECRDNECIHRESFRFFIPLCRLTHRLERSASSFTWQEAEHGPEYGVQCFWCL